MGGQKIILFL